MKRLFILCLCCILLVAGIGRKAKASSRPASGQSEDTSSIERPYMPLSFEDLGFTGYDEFCDVLAAKLIDGSKNSNLSPISVYLALAMTADGAEGDTQTAMLKLLGCESIEELREVCSTMLAKLSIDTEYSSLALADSIWIADQNGALKFNDEYLAVLADTYRAEASAVEFGKAETGKQIAGWITEHTRGKIKITEDAMQFGPETIAVLINTLYLKGPWLDEFHESATEAGTFFGPEGESTVDYMNRTYDSEAIMKGDGFMRYSLPLRNVGHMMFILPDEGVAFSDILGSPERIHALTHGGQVIRANVNVKLPKFKFQDRFDLNDTLKALGIDIAFSGRADFSGMGDFKAKISNVLQESFIGIDENGVEAAAYTMDSGVVARLPEDLPEIDFFLTRPFLYAIEAYDGTLLLIGSVTTPDSVGSNTTTE